MGHEDLFSRRRLSDRCRFGQGTFARMRGNGRDAPIPAIREAAIEPSGSTRSGYLRRPPSTNGDARTWACA
jgi:hypothetical protein